MERFVVHLRFRDGEGGGHPLSDRVLFVDDANLAWLRRRAAAGEHAVRPLDRELDAAIFVAAEFMQLVRPRIVGCLLPANLALEIHIHIFTDALRQLGQRVLRRHLLHRHHERHRPVRRVQHHEVQFAGLDEIDDLLRLGLADVPMSHVAPEDQHIRLVECLGGQALFRLVDVGRGDVEPGIFLQVLRDVVAGEVGIQLLRHRLLLVPDQDVDLVVGKGCTGGQRHRGKRDQHAFLKMRNQ